MGIGKFVLGALVLGAYGASAGCRLTGDTVLRETARDTVSTGTRPLGLVDLQVGINSRSSTVQESNFPENKFANHAVGFSGRMQSSVRWSLRAHRNRKFTWGDILGAEVFIGQLTSGLSHQTGSLWVAYKFEFGWGSRLRINSNNDLGLNVILLKFSRDNVSGNISGSGVTARYRHKKIMLEVGFDARHDRVFGVATDIQKKIPLQFIVTGRYLLTSGRNMGVTLETLPASYPQDNYFYTKTWSIKIFYGIYF